MSEQSKNDFLTHKKNLFLQFKFKLDHNPDYQCFREFTLKTLP